MVLKKGMTLVEILVVMAILVLLAFMILIALNPRSMVDRANDTQRKKDLNRIKVAFEEYFNDKGCYPTQDFVDSLSCHQDTPWLSSWPCDPNGSKYIFNMDTSSCPLFFRIYTKLLNEKDSQIPAGWYDSNITYTFGNGSLTKKDINFGVSSSNVSWVDRVLPAYCISGFGQCYRSPGPGRCQAITDGEGHVQKDAYTENNCLAECLVECCYNGDICK